MALEKKEVKKLTRFEFGFLVFVFAIIAPAVLLVSVYSAPIYSEGESYQIEVLADGQMQVRKATRVYRDDTDDGIDNGVAISPPTYHRHVLSPGADVTEEVERVKAVSVAVWTEDTVKKYKDKQKKNEPVEVIVEPVEELIIGE